jgi:hypothetical protein
LCYINFSRPIAIAMNFAKGDIIEWKIVDKVNLAGEKGI